MKDFIYWILRIFVIVTLVGFYILGSVIIIKLAWLYVDAPTKVYLEKPTSQVECIATRVNEKQIYLDCKSR